MSSTDFDDDTIERFATQGEFVDGDWCMPDELTTGRMALEIKRRRAEQAAGREHVERALRSEIDREIQSKGYTPGGAMFAHVIARRVADRLSVTVLSVPDSIRSNVALARSMFALDGAAEDATVKLLCDYIDSLIAAGKP